MKNYTGFLLKQYRHEHNLSQESLCKGICAISYLSKIENGQADASNEIITLLFQKFDIQYYQDDDFLNYYSGLFFRFFDSYFHTEYLKELSSSISDFGKQLKHSPLNIKYLLFEIYNMENQNQQIDRGEKLEQSILVKKESFTKINSLENIKLLEDTIPLARESSKLSIYNEKKNSISKEIASKLEILSVFIEYMDKSEKFLYHIAQGFTGKWQDQLETFHQADTLLPCSISSYMIAEVLCNNGKPDISLEYCVQGYCRAVEEGNIQVMKEISFTKLKCYGNIGNMELLKKEYNKCCELGRGDNVLMKIFHYNTGACFLEWGGYEESILYLLKALVLGETDCLTHQKLALAYGKLNNHEKASYYVNKAYEYLPKNHTLYYQMVRFSELRLTKDYLLNKEYIEILNFLYDHLEEALYTSFKKFYTPFIIELLESQRRYKEATKILKENYISFYE